MGKENKKREGASLMLAFDIVETNGNIKGPLMVPGQLPDVRGSFILS